jgi:hypothetical protein
MDLWWHLATGRYMFQSGGVPRVDVFSLTERGHAWLNLEWLYQLVLYSFYRVAGYGGVQCLKILLIVGALYFVFKRLRLYGLSLAECAPILAFIFWAGRYGWAERSDLVSLAFLSAFLWQLEAFRLQKIALKGLWPWPFLFVLWANAHPGFILGLGVSGLYAMWAVQQHPKQAWRILSGWGLCVAATCVTPFGIEAYRGIVHALYLAGQVDQTEFQRTPWTPMQFFWAAVMVLYGFLLRAQYTRKSLPWLNWIVTLGFTWAAIRHVRYVPFFMVGAFPYGIPFLIAELRRVRGYAPRWGFPAGIAITVCGCVYAAHGIALGVAPGLLPVNACEFIAAHPASGNYFNEYNFGSYWIWRFAGHPPVFVDGRSSTVEGYIALRQEIKRAQEGTPAEWDQFMDHYDIGSALIYRPPPAMVSWVSQNYFPTRRWALVYSDNVALWFLKRNTGNQKTIVSCEIKRPAA